MGRTDLRTYVVEALDWMLPNATKPEESIVVLLDCYKGPHFNGDDFTVAMRAHKHYPPSHDNEDAEHHMHRDPGAAASERHDWQQDWQPTRDCIGATIGSQPRCYGEHPWSWQSSGYGSQPSGYGERRPVAGYHKHGGKARGRDRVRGRDVFMPKFMHPLPHLEGSSMGVDTDTAGALTTDRMSHGDADSQTEASI